MFVIDKLTSPTSVREIRSFLGLVGFYRWFIKDFYMIYKPLTGLLMKDTEFDFNYEFLESFRTLKKELIFSSII